MFNRDRNFKVGTASRKTIRFSTLGLFMISNIQRSWRRFRDVTVIWSFLMGLETTVCGARVSFRHPFTLNSLFASMLSEKGWLGARKLTLSPGAGNHRYVRHWT